MLLRKSLPTNSLAAQRFGVLGDYFRQHSNQNNLIINQRLLNPKQILFSDKQWQKKLIVSIVS